MTFHADTERLKALQQDPGIEGRQRRAGRAQHRSDLFVDEGFRSQYGATQNTSLAVDVFCGGMDHHIRTQLDRLLERRGTETVIDDQQGTAALGNILQRPDICDFSNGIRGRLEKEQARVRLHGLLPCARFARGHIGYRDTKTRQQVREQLDGRTENTL